MEGKYDKIALSQILDAHIVTTEGFSLFKNQEKKALLQRLGEEYGLLVLTDSDGGGRQIRSVFSTLLPKDRVKHLYIPEREGKEKRKKTASKAGYLGVEGMDAETLRRIFLPFENRESTPRGREITKTDLYMAGLLGKDGSADRRQALAKRLDLPNLTSNALLEALNLLYDYPTFLELVENALADSSCKNNPHF